MICMINLHNQPSLLLIVKIAWGFRCFADFIQAAAQWIRAEGWGGEIREDDIVCIDLE